MKQPRRKLVVRRETLRVLEQKELAQAAGGDSELEVCPTTVPRRGAQATAD
jgi:hypothetical protein